jgi:transcriptional regulator with XRE-family HTH domain
MASPGAPLHSREYACFRAILVAARHAAGQTQAELAALLNRPQSFVSKFESGERRLDVPEFVAIAKALQLDPLKLMRQYLKSVG